MRRGWRKWLPCLQPRAHNLATIILGEFVEAIPGFSQRAVDPHLLAEQLATDFPPIGAAAVLAGDLVDALLMGACRA